jgi:hypothetical protein
MIDRDGGIVRTYRLKLQQLPSGFLQYYIRCAYLGVKPLEDIVHRLHDE